MQNMEKMIEGITEKACFIHEDFHTAYGDRYDEHIEAFAEELRRLMKEEHNDETLALFNLITRNEHSVFETQFAFCAFVTVLKK